MSNIRSPIEVVVSRVAKVLCKSKQLKSCETLLGRCVFSWGWVGRSCFLRFSGYISPYFVTDSQRLVAELKKSGTPNPPGGKSRNRNKHYHYAPKRCFSHRIHVWYMFTYIWLVFMVNVGKYAIHGSYGFGMKNTWYRKDDEILE